MRGLKIVDYLQRSAYTSISLAELTNTGSFGLAVFSTRRARPDDVKVARSILLELPVLYLLCKSRLPVWVLIYSDNQAVRVAGQKPFFNTASSTEEH